jgi:hypothetical protein
MSEKEDVFRRLTTSIEAAARLRAKARRSSDAAVARNRLRTWQASRLARTHADLLASAEYADAARFFLTDLYGPAEIGNRDMLMQRVAPIMSKTLPVAGLEAIADAIDLDALSESLDADMVAALGDDIGPHSAAAYGRAYRAIGRRADRARQIDLIEHLGGALESLTRQRFIGAALAAMRKPARLAGFGELQAFLERGYGAFGKMKKVAPFLDAVVSRERAVSSALFAGDDSPLDAGVPGRASRGAPPNG